MEEKPLSTGEPTTGSLPDKTDSSLGEGDLTAPPNQEKFASPRKLHGVSVRGTLAFFPAEEKRKEEKKERRNRKGKGRKKIRCPLT